MGGGNEASGPSKPPATPTRVGASPTAVGSASARAVVGGASGRITGRLLALLEYGIRRGDVAEATEPGPALMAPPRGEPGGAAKAAGCGGCEAQRGGEDVEEGVGEGAEAEFGH